MDDKLFIEWNDFETNVSKSFGLLRNEEYLHDVTLVCDDNSQVSAHKLVLSACSEYFKTIFKNNSHPYLLICLEGVPSTELRNILDYIYNGEANILKENLDTFLSLAKRLKIFGLLQNEDDNLLDLTAEQGTINEQEECDEQNGGETIKNEMNNFKSENEDYKEIDAVQRLVEIDREVDKHIETSHDGNLKCTFCGKVDNANGKSKLSTRRTNMRSHVETHLEGITYQCHFCDTTFRTRSSYSNHKRRFHK